MIHYTCDCCKRTIDSKHDLRYVVRMEVYASVDPMDEELDDDRDHLQELQDILESMEDLEDPGIGEDVYHQVRFDLCSECRKRFVQNPLGRSNAQKLNFSKN